MNLVLLVEGAETEPKVYEAWLRQRLPALERAANIANLTTDGYVLISGKGYPSYSRLLPEILGDIDEHPGKVHAFWICVDSDDDSYEDRYADVSCAVTEARQDKQLAMTNPSLEVRILVQHCCIETWFLGHEGFARAATQSPDIVKFKRFFDVSIGDPEEMSRGLGYRTRQSLHLAYLKAMLVEHGRPYSKKDPGIVCHPSYFEALQKRCARTGHLGSFQKLLSALGAASPAGETLPHA